MTAPLSMGDLEARRDRRERFIFFTPPVIALMAVAIKLFGDADLAVPYFLAVAVFAVATSLWAWAMGTCLWMNREIGRRRRR